MIRYALLASSIGLSSGRSIFSKKITHKEDNKFVFFSLQTILFLVSLLVIIFSDLTNFFTISSITLIYGVIYGLLLISAQWLYSISLKTGSASICSMIYSFGFILPTICSFIFWEEQLTLLKVLGIICAVIVILLISLYKDKEKKSNKFIIPLLLSTLSSGGLGIMQKIQQRSMVASEKSGFLFVAFSLAFISSLIVSFCLKKKQKKLELKPIIYSSLCGLCFGLANLINTILAGLFPGSILFPIQNIGVIILVTVLGFFIFKEKPKKNEIIAFLFGVVSIILLSI